MNTELGRFFFLLHLSAMKEGTKLWGILLKLLKKSRGLSFLALWMERRVDLAF